MTKSAARAEFLTDPPAARLILFKRPSPLPPNSGRAFIQIMSNDNNNSNDRVDPWKLGKRGFVRGVIWTAVIPLIAWW